jgi:hypothetical protein
MSALYRFELLLPLRFNDGREVPRELISQTIVELEERFEGVTWESQVCMGGGDRKGNPIKTNWCEFSSMPRKPIAFFSRTIRVH